MSFAPRVAGVPSSFSSASSFSLARPVGAATHDFLLIALAFEAVTSGPWVSDSNTAAHLGTSQGWKRLFVQAPSASGAGLEAWAAVNGGAGSVTVDLLSSLTGIAVMLGWTGEYFTTGSINDGCVRDSESAQWTGANAEAPSLFAFQNELVIALAAQIVQSPGFGTPTPDGWTARFNGSRSSSFSNVSLTVADLVQPLNGDTGSIPWSTTVSGSPKGATGTIAVIPQPTPSGPGSAPLSFRFKPV